MSSTLADELEALTGDGQAAELARRLREWDGDYAAESTGAVAFECFLHHLVLGLYGGKRPADLPDLYSQWSYLTTYLMPDLRALSDARRQACCWKRRPRRRSTRLAIRPGGICTAFGWRTALPGCRSRVLRLSSPAYPSAALGQTPMKMAHGLVNGRHSATFGSMARHISDMSDLDANWFALLGGNDGWLGSANFCDHLPLWRDAATSACRCARRR